MKILIVDDNKEERTIVHYYLLPFGSEIFEAVDGTEGLVIARSERPDLIISDALMPNMDGFEFLREVRKLDELNDSFFIICSAIYAGDQDEELALSLGADAFLHKPLDVEAFLERLKGLLAGQDRTKKEYRVNFSIMMKLPEEIQPDGGR